jgi:hypothetical protein
VLVSHEEKSKAQLRDLQAFLGVSGPPDDHYEKLEGSCQWIDDRNDFREWREAEADIDPAQNRQHTPSVYWVTANPGAGKTVLAGHIVSQFREFNFQHAFYHFHVGQKALQSLAGCLRSVAFQMAIQSSAIRATLARLNNEGVIVDQDDARSIWMKVFKAAILQVCCTAFSFHSYRLRFYKSIICVVLTVCYVDIQILGI